MIPKFVCFFLACILLFSCSQKEIEEPIINLDTYVIEQGFQLKAIASEPFIEAPVAMDFDNQGRIWVVEMKGFMQSLEGLSEDIPNGTISILEDLDHDGVVDNARIFEENLVLPRALAHVYGGLLYAEPPNLWFVEIENDKPKIKILVDSLYADGGNVEHQPNGLLIHTDNWIYNAKSNFRYQRKDDEWLKEPTTFRGQWGITKDDFGRLYYNNNSTQIKGDYVLPNTSINNPYFRPSSSVDKTLTKNQRVYPLHATSVNRGYQKGVLDKDSLLINVTSSCGPLVYRGDNFNDEYYENAFACAPEANLIKRNLLEFYPDSVAAKQAWDNKEFLASTDEGFRPVNLNNGPDGAMYVVDMHRGIIQDKAYMSSYLKDHMANKQLDTIMGMGRILKITSNTDIVNAPIDLDALNTKELIELLNHPNGWMRDRAQQILIYKNDKNAISLLKELVLNSIDKPITQIHALHALNGFDALDFDFLASVLSAKTNSKTIAHGLILIQQFADESHVESMSAIVNELINQNNPEIDLYLAMTLNNWSKLSQQNFFPSLGKLSRKYNEKRIYQEAIMVSLTGLEKEFSEYSSIASNFTSSILGEMNHKTLANIELDRKSTIYTAVATPTDNRTVGYNMYRNSCAICHGMGGDGINGVAPPLVDSEYINDGPEKLALVLLHGLKGPIHVNGQRYEFNGVMPGLNSNPEVTDQVISDLINYLNNSFVTKGKKIEPEKVKELRGVTPKNTMFTEEELNSLQY